MLRQLHLAASRIVDVWSREGAGAVVRQAGVKLRRALRGEGFRLAEREPLPPTLDAQYAVWLARRGRDPDAAAMAGRLRGLQRTPLVSVLLAVDAGEADQLEEAVRALLRQVYAHWELCLAVSRGARLAVAAPLAAITGDARVRLSPADPESATFADAWPLARGELVALVDAADRWAPHALLELVARAEAEPACDIVYSDEDDLRADGTRVDPFFKPDWSPELLLSTNYLQRAGLIRRTLVEAVGGPNVGLPAGQAYDLALRAGEQARGIAHVPLVLAHRRRQPMDAAAILRTRAANQDETRALEAALARRGWPGQSAAIFSAGGRRCYATRAALRAHPLVSIVIPTRDNARLLRTTIESVQQRTAYDRYEIVVVDTGSTEPEAVAYLQSLEPSCRVLVWRAPFNYSAVNNLGVAQSSGDHLLFLNNDVEVIHGDWLVAMLEHAQQPEVGAVGARLLYADGRIQHAGVVVGINRSAGNAFRTQPGEPAGSPRLADLARDALAVTGACMLVPRRVFDEVGGFDERLRLVLNDVDLCLRIRQRGYRVVYTPQARLYHYEGSSRGLAHPPADQQIFEARWDAQLVQGDPFYSPNLTHTRDDWSLRLDGGGK